MVNPDGKAKPDQRSAPRPGGQLARIQATHEHSLDHVDLHSLMIEFWNRLARGESPAASDPMITLGDAIAESLANSLDVHGNRFSRLRAADLFAMFQLDLGQPRPPIAGASYLDLGCGPVNPYGMGMLLGMLGATRCVSVDLVEILDAPRALRGLARLFDVTLQNPRKVLRDFPISRQQIEQNMAGIDVESLRRGDPKGLGSRLGFLRESASKLSARDGSFDVVISNSFLEHVDDIHAVLSDLARVTAKGGFGVHAIDGVDHWSYGDKDRGPHDFLREPAPGMVHGSNRIRVLEFPALFEKHGFSIQQVIPRRKSSLTPQEIARFAPPWSTMSREMLETTLASIVVRRK